MSKMSEIFERNVGRFLGNVEKIFLKPTGKFPWNLSESKKKLRGVFETQYLPVIVVIW